MPRASIVAAALIAAGLVACEGASTLSDSAVVDLDAARTADSAADSALDAIADHLQQPDQPQQPQDDFCRGWQDCVGAEVCDLCRGRCERRESWPASAIEIFTLKPLAAAAGDRLIVDGQRFYTGLLGMLSVTVSVGGTQLAGWTLALDENRIVVPLTAGMSGPVQVTGSGATATSTESLVPANAGVLACDNSTPVAAGVPGTDVARAGPFAAAYVDHPSFTVRVHYPAQCGSVRRPATPGTYPLVLLLHGDGGGYLNYEYLAQYLATWGFVAVMPETADVKELQQIASQLRGVDIGGALGAMAQGVVTTKSLALVGHSRGTARMQGLVADATLGAATVASVFLGPVDDGTVVPGLFMVFGATLDLQSSAAEVDAAYARQAPPKWKIVIQGGNHSLFTDHKVWAGPLFDAKPTISRTDQFQTVSAFVLPLLERAFGSTEHFPAQLDAPPPSALYTVTFAK